MLEFLKRANKFLMGEESKEEIFLKNKSVGKNEYKWIMKFYLRFYELIQQDILRVIYAVIALDKMTSFNTIF